MRTILAIAFLVFAVAAPKKEDIMPKKIRIKTKYANFTATLTDSPTANAFAAQLPLTAVMTELNGNEKYLELPKRLPVNAAVPAGLEAGDLMLYGSGTLVLFYKGLSTTYSYTRIGRVDDTAGLATALGTGNISVCFELIGMP